VKSGTQKSGALLRVLISVAAAVPAHAQSKWPERPVRVVVPFAPGGATDVVARILAPRLAEEFNQQFIIDNRAGAGGTIGVDIVVRANPDGNTILIGASSYASNVPLYKLSFDPIRGISPVTLITRGPFIITVHPSVAASTVKELIALARAKPASLTFGSSGTGSVPHLATEHFWQTVGTTMVHVPFKGDAPAITALLGGQIQIYFGGPLVLSPHINAGKLRGLAVTSEQRSPIMPDLPAVNEVLPGYTAFTWFGMWAPIATPKPIIAQLNEAVGRILKKPEVQDRLRKDGMDAAHNTPDEFSHFIQADIAKWTKVVKVGNIKVD
jgi:tripartite-type tricarboxylate transporter receptor subunit TctC